MIQLRKKTTEKKCIEMEINKTTLSVYYAARLFGFAPYSIQQNKLNQIIQVKYSRFLCIYSVTLLILLGTLTNYGIYFDATSAIPLRLKTATQKVVTSFDVNVLVGCCLIAMLTGVYGLQNTQQMNASLNKADQKLMGLCENISLHTLGARRLLTTFVSIVYVYICSMLEYALWRSNEPINRPSMGLYLKRHNFVASVNHAKPNYNAFNIHTTDEIINQFADIHELLGKAMVNVSSEFGVTILLLLVSCMLHLVVTGYFFFLEVFGNRDTFYTTVQVFWLIFHALRLILIIEPCHFVAAEAGRTMKIVCDLLRMKGEHYALKKFWCQLMADNNTFFSACGMCRIDRPLLTTLFGAIATYLVILLQFNRANEEQNRKS
ncbi:gustatory receptor for sugar taste 43a-like [Contarinia nasturtii]|uniref:gustatory receptor for sugar taste 43a-like n=1 Tax=Contarinia nasturtii TaxID=265458 RepID=UPI0012D4B2A6|nr:gustatory receptor for sugar taste 43a-like [Contarinia nasturtii]